jgi:DNA gyrase subunit A
MINLLPLAAGEVITTVLPLPEDEESWGALHLMFATAHGAVRATAWMRSRTSDGRQDRDEIRTCRGRRGRGCDRPPDRGRALLGEDDVLLATRSGKAIRFMSTAIREFQSRSSTGRARGPAARERRGHLHVDPAPRRHHVGRARSLSPLPAVARARGSRLHPSPERMAEMAEREQFILTVTENGFGKRTSAYEYRRTNRGRPGHHQHRHSARNGGVVASFPVKPGEQIMLATDQGKMIRTTVGSIRIAGRNTQGVMIFRVAMRPSMSCRWPDRRGG